MENNLQNNETYELVKKWFKNDEGEPFKLKPSQVEIFEKIFVKKHPRVQIMTYTQYGKSDVVAMAVLTRVNIFNEKWAIVAPTTEKAKIIQSYAIGHIFDNDYFRKKFEIRADENLERIKRERSRSRITFRNSDGIGEIYIISAEATKKGEDAGNKLMGFGARNIVEDESSLIDDRIHTKVLRMLGGHKENFLAKVGNPFRRNHFLRSFNNPKFRKIVVPWQIGLDEGRQTKEFFEEAREECSDDILWGVLYECKFPQEDMIDLTGYSTLFFSFELEKAETEDFQFYGDDRLGCDVAGAGTNYSVIVRRSANGAEVLYKENNPDVMSFTGIILENMEKLRVDPKNVSVDVVGIGKGVFDRLVEQKKNVIPFNAGESAQDDKGFFNKRAETYFRLSKWIKEGGKLKSHPDWKQILNIRYKVMSDRKIQLKSKNQMLLDGIRSPDVADALAMTFANPDFYGIPGGTQKRITGIGTQRGALKPLLTQKTSIKGIGR